MIVIRFCSRVQVYLIRMFDLICRLCSAWFRGRPLLSGDLGSVDTRMPSLFYKMVEHCGYSHSPHFSDGLHGVDCCMGHLWRMATEGKAIHRSWRFVCKRRRDGIFSLDSLFPSQLNSWPFTVISVQDAEGRAQVSPHLSHALYCFCDWSGEGLLVLCCLADQITRPRQQSLPGISSICQVRELLHFLALWNTRR